MEPAYVFTLTELESGRDALSAPLPVAWLAHALDGTELSTAEEDGQLEVRLTVTGKDVLVQGKVGAKIRMACARCVEPTDIEISAELSLLLVPAISSKDSADKGAKNEDSEWELSADSGDMDTYDGEKVVLDPFLREAILLEVPIFPLCSASCPGIGAHVPDPGIMKRDDSTPVDPRLAPLLRLSVRKDEAK